MFYEVYRTPWPALTSKIHLIKWSISLFDSLLFNFQAAGAGHSYAGTVKHETNLIFHIIVACLLPLKPVFKPVFKLNMQDDMFIIIAG